MRKLAAICVGIGLISATRAPAFARHARPTGSELISPAATALVSTPDAVSGAFNPAIAKSVTFAQLPTLRFSNQNTGAAAQVRLYDDRGQVDEQEAQKLDALLCDTRDPKNWATIALDRRTLQLSVRAAFHFHVNEIAVVSAYRQPGRRREGPHAEGRAIDFRLPGVAPRLLASYLRTLPRVGVGIYTHPKTGFVHLDDREHSFHWLDASPPGRHWRERSIGGRGLALRDASYSRADDWPEGTTPPPVAL
ncbi:MAG: DUF882 domain-containing protein [Polyangiaceae bacterium]